MPLLPKCIRVAALVGCVFALLGLTHTKAVTALPNTWSPSASMATARSQHTATLLLSGKVLVAGGGTLTASAELYDPLTDTWSPAASMDHARYFHTATLLPNGKVLVAGGSVAAVELGSAELYDPVLNSWSSAGSMSTQRWYHTATLLSNGTVLVTGGYHNGGLEITAEIYDPATNSWTPAAHMNVGRYRHAATLLSDGRVLVTGGDTNGPTLASAELYDPTLNEWSYAASMANARRVHTASLLSNGKVLVAGGTFSNGSEGGLVGEAELYDPATDAWSSATSMQAPRAGHSATVLPSGSVLVAGGSNFVGPLTAAEVYDPSTNAWASVASMAVGRTQHTATLLPNGNVLAAGGGPDITPFNTAEIYEPEPTDSDGDGIADPGDNCVAVPNPDQANTDAANAAANHPGADPLGDACDDDIDGDGYANVDDGAPVTYCGIMRADVDGDGAVSILDLATVAQDFTSHIPPANPRFGQDTDNVISILDLATIANAFFLHAIVDCPGAAPADVVVIMDRSGSMSDAPCSGSNPQQDGCKIHEAKVATTNLIDLITGHGTNSKVGFAPFTDCYNPPHTGAVNTCVPAPAPDNLLTPVNCDVTGPSNVTCLNSNIPTARLVVNSVVAGGATNICLGLLEGRKILRGPGNQHTAANPDAKRFAIVISDGENVYQASSNAGNALDALCRPSNPTVDGGAQACAQNRSTSNANLDLKAIALATSMKADVIDNDVEMFTIQLYAACVPSAAIATPASCDLLGSTSLTTGEAGSRLLKCIASSTPGTNDHYFATNDATTLNTIMQQIATTIRP